MTVRGSGQTTQAMLAAPQGARYIWCNGQTDYPRSLAEHLGRKDLVILAPSDVERRPYLIRGVVPIFDHALKGLITHTGMPR